MAEQMISREDAKDLGFAINEMVNDLEGRGFERAHIGSAMAGVGLALVKVHEGHRAAIAIVSATRDALMDDLGYPQH